VFQTGVPLRRQLEDSLRVAIRSGRLGPGSLLPGEADLPAAVRLLARAVRTIS
jgi:DNA-binding GntR family transcriptional regulator